MENNASLFWFGAILFYFKDIHLINELISTDRWVRGGNE